MGPQAKSPDLRHGAGPGRQGALAPPLALQAKPFTP